MDANELRALADAIVYRDSLAIARAADYLRAQADAQPVAVPAGWKLVPVEPTPEMLSAVGMMDGYDWHAPGCSPDADHANWYSAMIAAAPAAPQAEPLTDERITKGEYVFATKWDDGDPGDHWGVGFYDRFANGRHYVVDSAGKQIRGNGFRRVGRITVDVGRWLLSAGKSLEASPPGTVNLWTMLTERARRIGGNDGN